MNKVLAINIQKFRKCCWLAKYSADDLPTTIIYLFQNMYHFTLIFTYIY